MIKKTALLLAEAGGAWRRSAKAEVTAKKYGQGRGLILAQTKTRKTKKTGVTK